MTVATARDICQFLNADGTCRLRPSTLRVWVHRGRLSVCGRRGRWNLYDVREVVRLAADTRTVREIADTAVDLL